jgi:hypothetical protein
MTKTIRTDNVLNEQATLRFYFFSNAQFLKMIFCSPQFGTFAFVPTLKPKLQKQKSQIFPHRHYNEFFS